jgi:uncharacterized membrane protein YedE/YeeE
MQLIVGLVSGVIFGLGLSISGMLSPVKVSAFLDLAGAWDPSLAFVMGGGLIVNILAMLVLKKRTKPFFAEGFSLPQSKAIDRPLLGGAALFGIGWALGGLCPGPAIASLAYLSGDALMFFIPMLVGLYSARFIFSKI